MDEKTAFLELIKDIGLTDVIVFILGVIYITPFIKKAYNWLKDYFKKTEKQEVVLGNAEKLPDWHQQSIDIRNGLRAEIAELREQFKELQEAIKQIADRLDKMEQATKNKELNKTRNLLLQSYQYYTNKTRNPMQAWTKMEADTFWALFKDYKDNDGDGYMDSDVEPAMNKLQTIPMIDQAAIVSLMQSRR